VVDAPIEVLLEVLMDIPSYPQWMYECKQTIPLEQKGDLYRVLYFAQGVPFGSPDRDAVIEAVTVNDWKAGTSVTTLQSTDSYPFSLESEANKEANQAAGGTQYVPPKRQRMIEFSGKWDLRMVDRNRTRVIYTAYTNPGGFAPRFVVNGVIRKVSFRSLKGLIRMAREPKYIQAAEKGIVKPDIEKAIAQGELKFAATAQPQAGAQ